MRLALVLGLLGAVSFSSAGSAHHYMAEFDRDNPRALTGTVKEWQWTNPHSWLILTVAQPGGRTVQWALETAGPMQARKQGMTRTMMKPGDKVDVMVAPRKDGRPEGGLAGLLMINGKPGPGQMVVEGGAPPGAARGAANR